MAPLALSTGCDEEEAGRAFREAASGSLQSGMKSIMDAFIDGMFAIFELGGDQGSPSTS